MKKQKTLFNSIEPKKKSKKIKKPIDIKKIENKEELQVESNKINKKIENIVMTKKVLKNNMFTCKCGLRINWKIAEARKECPQCNLNIEESDLYDILEVE